MLTRQTTPSRERDDVGLASVAQRYRVRDEGVGRFLRQNLHLVPVLLEIADVLPADFGLEAPMFLEMVVDPENDEDEDEDEDEDGELVAFVGVSPSAGSALERLWAFDEGWWLRQVPRVGGQLSVTFEYV